MINEEGISFEFLKCVGRLNNNIDRGPDTIKIAIELHCKITPPADPPLDYADVIIALLFIILASPGTKKDDAVGIGSLRDDLNDPLERGLPALMKFRRNNVSLPVLVPE